MGVAGVHFRFVDEQQADEVGVPLAGGFVEQGALVRLSRIHHLAKLAQIGEELRTPQENRLASLHISVSYCRDQLPMYVVSSVP